MAFQTQNEKSISLYKPDHPAQMPAYIHIVNY